MNACRAFFLDTHKKESSIDCQRMLAQSAKNMAAQALLLADNDIILRVILCFGHGAGGGRFRWKHANRAELMALSRRPQFLKKRRATPAALPTGLRLYVIGDVHGRLDLLDALSAKISADLTDAPADVLTIFVGDYIDRGKDSAGVIERLSRAEFPTPLCALRGNHEEVLLSFLDDDNVLDSWRNYGGLETLHSYGVSVSEPMRGRGYDAARKSLLERLPESHLGFLRRTALSVTYGDYFFAHAGVRPGVPFDRQHADDLLWIREEFLGYREPLDKIVVHGHTPVNAPDIQPNRINIDTGAFATSVLTALVLEGVGRRILQTRAEQRQ